jgi:hypothetical protein
MISRSGVKDETLDEIKNSQVSDPMAEIKKIKIFQI